MDSPKPNNLPYYYKVPNGPVVEEVSQRGRTTSQRKRLLTIVSAIVLVVCGAYIMLNVIGSGKRNFVEEEQKPVLYHDSPRSFATRDSELSTRGKLSPAPPQPTMNLLRDTAGDPTGDKFASCCRESGMTSACGEGWCTYPPTDPWTPWDIKCWGEHIQAFIQCYTQKRNNQVCCAQKDVVGMYSICQDLCNGNATQFNFNFAYVSLCKARKDVISQCNHDSSSLAAGANWDE